MSALFGVDGSFQVEAEGRLFAAVSLTSTVKGFGGGKEKIVSFMFFCEMDAAAALPGEGAKEAAARLWSGAAWRRAKEAFAECPAALKGFGSGSVSVQGFPTALTAKFDPIRLTAAERASLPPAEELFETVAKLAEMAFLDLAAASMQAPDFKGRPQGAILAAEASEVWTRGLAAFAESRLIGSAAGPDAAASKAGPRL